MNELVALVAAGAILIVTVVSGRLSRIWFTEPLMAALLGVVLGQLLSTPIDISDRAVLTFLELALALVLFSDASRISVRELKADYSWPTRMLGIGLPLAIAFGTAAAMWLLGLPFGFALLLGVVLAPTDAALAGPVLSNHSVPSRIRQSLNVESGLNDGLAVPALLIATGLIEADQGMSTQSEAVTIVLSQLGIGIVGGLAVGFFGAWVILRGTAAGWMDPLHQKIAAMSLAIAGYGAVQLLGGSGFVAAFIAGAIVSHQFENRAEYLYDFAEAEGHIMVTLAFLFVGAGPITELISEGVSWQAVVMALIALLVVRPIAIGLSLVGQKLMSSTVVFLGWFGPRGLATVVFFLVATEELPVVPDVVRETVILTVALSILLHGLSAVPASQWLANRFEGMDDEDMPEMGESFEHPMRRG